MAGCLSVSVQRYRVFVTVQQCLNNSITKTPKQLYYRESCTYCAQNWSIFPQMSNVSFANRPAVNNLQTSIFRVVRNDNILHTSCCQFSSSDKKSDGPEDLLDGKQMTRFQKIKYLLKNYWHVAIPVHLVTSLVWLGGFYYLSVSGVDIVKLMETLQIPDNWVERVRKTKATHFVTTYLLYKLATPFRYAVTIGGTSISIKILKQKGMLKHVPNVDQLKRMCKEQIGDLRNFTRSYRNKLNSKKGVFVKRKEEIKQQCVEARDELQRSVSDSKRELKKGAKELSSECKQVGGLFYKYLKQLIQNKPKADYVAKLIKDMEKK